MIASVLCFREPTKPWRRGLSRRLSPGRARGWTYFASDLSSCKALQSYLQKQSQQRGEARQHRWHHRYQRGEEVVMPKLPWSFSSEVQTAGQKTLVHFEGFGWPQRLFGEAAPEVQQSHRVDHDGALFGLPDSMRQKWLSPALKRFNFGMAWSPTALSSTWNKSQQVHFAR